eukprot:TRINITY_DN22246_c0_g1_i2.p2 TRINITY_DN22246_c0_g1~~TRINITY_DN22246_c0_g1_i2.p2  ORF type:complete len:197 (+),score=61.97 TRINITY_DN22246_c0_g1_i2:140-730(+)
MPEGTDCTLHEESGGCVTYLSIVDDVIGLEHLFHLVALPSCGAVASFCGTTRDNFDGKEVVELFYESYDEMALKEMGKIASAARHRWPDVKGIAIVHRKGLVPVKESSVVIAISSPHRVSSMEAVRFCIDTLKESVPIWKKEIYREGIPGWKQNSEFLASEVMRGRFNSVAWPSVIVSLAAAAALPLLFFGGRRKE